MRSRVASRRVLLAISTLAAIAMVAAACGSDGAPSVSTTVVSGPITSTPVLGTAMNSETSLVSGVSTLSETSTTASLTVSTTSPAPVTITVLYDNTATCPGTQAGWGFSCLIEGLEKTVLFDTGADGDMLLFNMEILRIEPEEIDVVVLSHDHDDHTGGLAKIVARNPDVTVYYPSSFSEKSVASAREAGAHLVPVDAAVSPCAGLFVTSPLGRPSESALLVDTAEGQVLVSGCAHPGIAEMAKAASDLVDEPVFAVVGGFHLLSHSADEVDRIIQELRQLGVERCGPAHCTGEAATARMRAAFADTLIEMGVGSIIAF